MSMTRNRTVYLILALVVILLAAGLRLHRLGTQSLWNDEGASAAMTLRAPAAIVANSAADIHPPGYYLLLAGWSALTGRSEFALRALSALAGVLSVALVIALGRRLLDRPAGLIAGAILAAHTFAIYYAQEARMYALLGLLATAGMWALAVILTPAQRRDVRRDVQLNVPTAHRFWSFFALALINAAGLYTQYAYPLSMIAQGIVFLAVWIPHRDRGLLARYVAANGLALLLFAPWMGTALRQVTGWPNTGTGTDPGALLNVVGLGLTARAGIAWPVLFGGLILLAGGLWAARTRAVRLLPAVWLAVTAGGFLLLGLAPDDLKQLTPAASAAALILGMGAAALWREGCLTYRLLAVAGSLLIGLALIGGLPPLYADPAFARSDYRAMAARVLAETRPGDAVILNGPGQGEVWSYYTGEAGPPVYPLPRALGGDDSATQAEMAAILGDHRRIFVLFWGEAERDPNRVVETTLDGGAFEVDSAWYGDVRFVVYAAPGKPATAPDRTLGLRFGEHITLVGYALDRTAYVPGDALTLTLFWATDSPLDVRYKVFVHLYADPAAPPPAQHDSEPGGGLYPTIDWTPGQTVIDRHGLPIPADLPPGTYTLAVGLYDAADPTARLSGPQGDRAEIARVVVAPAGAEPPAS